VTPARDLPYVQFQRETVRKAMAMLTADIAGAEAELQRQRVSERLPEWREATHRIAITILELQRLNRLREKIRSEIGGDPALPAYALPRVLCGDGSFVGDGVYLFLQQAFAAGIIKSSEAQSNE